MGTYLVWEGEEMDCDGSSAAGCQQRFLNALAGKCEAARVRGVKRA
jgi:hypothetical protein